jgi:hypothetical protein
MEMERIFEIVAERRIQEAIDEGKFDNLPGLGKPIDLDEDLSTPPHLRAVNRILKNAGVVPDWMQLDIEIDREREELRRMWKRLEKEYDRRKSRILDSHAKGNLESRKVEFATWLSKERSGYLASIKRVNFEITKLAMMAPTLTRIHIPIKVAEETGRFDASFPSLPGVELPEQVQPERDEPIKDAVRSLYAQRKLGGR